MDKFFRRIIHTSDIRIISEKIGQRLAQLKVFDIMSKDNVWVQGKIDFSVVGAQKAGTSWLYRRLLEVEDFSMLPIKELHYFDRDYSYPSPSYLAQSKLSNRLRNKKWLKKAIRDCLSSIYRLKGWSVLKWKLLWYFSEFNDDWYLSLFKGKDHQLLGEINPDYSMLSENDISEMKRLAPDAKIVFLMRNPIDRAWSQIRFNDHHKRKTEEIINFINSERQELRGNYLRTIDLFTKIFSKKQLFIGFYDAIEEKPEKLLQEIVTHLGSNTKSITFKKSFQRKVNQSEKSEIPPHIYNHLVQKYRPMITELADRYGGYCSKWLQEIS